MESVAAYCRVSTSLSDQASSFQAQKNYFLEQINRNPNWQLYEIYADEGISGTALKNRTAFLKMMEDAEKGCFRYILTKEVSRFSRNIVDAIICTRRLKALGVGVIFMNDGINSLDADSELRLSIMASIAQEESRKTSQRVKWGQTRQMERGVVFGHSLLGYRLEKGVLSIEPKGAAAVRAIFEKYALEKKSASEIARELELAGIEKAGGSRDWTAGYILKILKNEKYVGDLVQKKSCTPNYLDHKKQRNEGHEELVTIRNHHEPVVSRELWELAQAELVRRRRRKAARGCSSSHFLSGRIFCGECGGCFVRRVRYRADGSRYVRWNCGNRLSNKDCSMGKALREETAEDMLAQALSWAAQSPELDAKRLAFDLSRALFYAAERETKAYEHEKRRLEEKLNTAVNAYVENSISRQELEKLRADCQARMSKLCPESSGLVLPDVQTLEESINKLLYSKKPDTRLAAGLLERLVFYRDGSAVLWLRGLRESFHFTEDKIAKAQKS